MGVLRINYVILFSFKVPTLILCIPLNPLWSLFLSLVIYLTIKCNNIIMISQVQWLCCDRIPQLAVYSYVNCDKANRVSPFLNQYISVYEQQSQSAWKNSESVSAALLWLNEWLTGSWVICNRVSISISSYLLVVSTSSVVNCDVLFSAQLDA